MPLRRLPNRKGIWGKFISSYPLKSRECNFQKLYYLKSKFKDGGYSGHLEGINDAIFAMASNKNMNICGFVMRRFRESPTDINQGFDGQE